MRDALRRRHHRRFPVRILRLYESSDEAPPGPLRRPHPDGRPLPSGTFGQRHGGRFHQEKTWRDPHRVPASISGSHPEGNLRRHPLSGTGHADRLCHGRLLPRPVRHAPPCHGTQGAGDPAEEPGYLCHRRREEWRR
ncbi:Uncharacterised protein [Bacteroides xylanisolvens]|nr:Uncharacterised protein [Bacteroides xylanisolvens]